MLLKSSTMLFGIALLSSFQLSSMASASTLDSLSPQDRATVLASLRNSSQKPVLLLEKVDGQIWEKMKVYEKANATPEEVAAVFTDFENAKNFFESLGVKTSEITSGAGTSHVTIHYYMDPPVNGITIPFGMGSDDYTCEDTISADASTGSYSVVWDVIKSKRGITKGSGKSVWTNGSITLEPFEGGTLVTYVNMLVPNSSFLAGLPGVKAKAQDFTKDFVDALIKQTQNEKASNPHFLEMQKSALEKALAP